RAIERKPALAFLHLVSELDLETRIAHAAALGHRGHRDCPQATTAREGPSNARASPYLFAIASASFVSYRPARNSASPSTFRKNERFVVQGPSTVSPRPRSSVSSPPSRVSPHATTFATIGS